MDSLFAVVFAILVFVLALWHIANASLDETVARLSRHWLLFLAFFFLCFTIAGYALHDFGVPSLFRDDPALYELYGWRAIRNSPTVWSQCFAALLLFAIWGFIYHFEELDSGSTNGKRSPGAPARGYILAHGAPMVLFLLAAFAFPRGGDSLFAWLDLSKALLGLGLALGILWLVTGVGGWLLKLLTRAAVDPAGRMHPRLARQLDRASLLSIGVDRSIPDGHDVFGMEGIKRRSRQFFRDFQNPPPGSETRRRTILIASVFMGLLVLTLVVLTRYPVLQSSVSILLVLAWLFAGYFAISFVRPWLRLWVVIFVASWIIWANSGRPHHQFPGLDDYYAAQDPKPLAPAKQDSGKSNPGDLLEPIKTLEAWHAGPGAACKNLVIVATSGGAYRAGYWTAALLDELETRAMGGDELAGLDRCVRLVTGASGGMVGAAYYVAMKNEVLPDRRIGSVIDRLNADTKKSRSEGPARTVTPYPRDSLTPVAQQLAQRDLFHVFLRGKTSTDRGIVLETQWRTLDIPFSALRQGESNGRIPSLLVSPLAFSKAGTSFAKPLLISNQAIDALAGPDWRYAIPFFTLFPGISQTFRVATAVRMNATFPYVSPAVSLPTAPPARVVDAGYYDNYGLASAASWLFLKRDSDHGTSVIDWLRNKGLGVILIQVRAFPFAAPPLAEASDCHAEDGSKNASSLSDGFQFLTSPLEALSAVRESGMNIRNEQQLTMLQALAGEKRLHWVSFENSADVGMSWYLTEREVDCLRKEVASPFNIQQWDLLKSILALPAPDPEDNSGNSNCGSADSLLIPAPTS